MADEPKETQPLLKDILEEMRSGFATLRAEMREEFNKLRIEVTDGFDAIRQELEMTNRHLGKIVYEIGRAQVRTDMIEERIAKLEGESNPQ